MKKILFTLLFLSVGFKAYGQATNPTLQNAAALTYNAKFSQSEAILNQYIQSNPLDPRGYILRGIETVWKQKITEGPNLDEQALEDFKAANLMAFNQWEKDPENVDKNVTLGNSYLFLAWKWIDMGKKTRAGLILKKAQKHMEFAVQKDPQRNDAKLAQGVFNFYAANIPAGLQFLTSLLGISGDAKVGLEQIAQAASTSHIYQPDSLFLLSYMYGQSKKNYTAANTQVSELIRRFPDNPYFYYLRGKYSLHGKEYEKSLPDFDVYDRMCAGRTPPCSSVDQYYSNYYRSVSLAKLGRFVEAKPFIQKAQALSRGRFNDKASDLHLYWAQALLKEGKKAEAKAALQAAIDAPDGNQLSKDEAEKIISTL